VTVLCVCNSQVEASNQDLQFSSDLCYSAARCRGISFILDVIELVLQLQRAVECWSMHDSPIGGSFYLMKYSYTWSRVLEKKHWSIVGPL